MQKTQKSSKEEVQKSLNRELERIQRKLGSGINLKVEWKPNTESKLSGQVKNETIFIYEENEYRALNTLRHEILDFYVSIAIRPYREIANILIKKMNSDAYQQKEKIVEALTKLITLS